MSASSPNQPASESSEAPPSFESAMERLETIVEQMENSRLPLEELIRCYEEGTRLIKVCSERLSAAEQRIEIITRDAAGQPRVVEVPRRIAAGRAAAPAPPPKSTQGNQAHPRRRRRRRPPAASDQKPQ